MGFAYPMGFPFGRTLARLGVRSMIRIEAIKDEEAGVFVGRSPDVPGLVLESDTLEGLVREARLVLPDFISVPEALDHSRTTLRYA